jgi:bacillithiol biosynthesis deacetylase BshB1
MSSRGTPERRQQEKQRASDLLGLSARLSAGLPDGSIGTHPDHRLPVIELIRRTRPRIVLAPYWEDRHPDHARASTLVREACFLAGVGKMGDGPAYRPERLVYYMLRTTFSASFIMDVSSVWERRMAAVRAYESQFQSQDGGVETALSSPGFLRALEARAIWFGWMIGAAYGEPFLNATPPAAREFPGMRDEEHPLGDLPAYRPTEET